MPHKESSKLRVLRALLHGSVLHPGACMRLSSSHASGDHQELSKSTPHIKSLIVIFQDCGRKCRGS